MYTTNGNVDSSVIQTDPSSSASMTNHNTLDDLSQSLNDSDLYIPQMFAV